MKIRGSVYVLIIIMALLLVTIVISLRMQYFASKLLPLIVSSALFILTAVELRREILSGKRSEVTVTGSETTRRGETRGLKHGYLFAAAWLISFVLAIYLLGFVIAIPSFVFSYIKSHGTRWLVAVTITIVTTGVVYGLFELVMGVELYRGLLFRLLGY